MTTLTPESLMTLMEKAKELGVSEFEHGELKFKFGANPKPQAPVEIPENKELLENQMDINELDVREEQLSHLMITDPEEYEELLASGQLTNQENPSDQ